MRNLTIFEPFFGLYPQAAAKRSSAHASLRSSRFASFTERERKYLSPKDLRLVLRAGTAVPARL